MALSFSSNEVIMARLFTGEFIIGRFEAANPPFGPKLLKVRALVLSRPANSNSLDIQIAPWGFPLFEMTDAASIPYPEHAIALAKVAPKHIADAYLTSISGLVMAGGKLPGLGG